jgi:hypothetical protein
MAEASNEDESKPIGISTEEILEKQGLTKSSRIRFERLQTEATADPYTGLTREASNIKLSSGAKNNLNDLLDSFVLSFRSASQSIYEASTTRGRGIEERVTEQLKRTTFSEGSEKGKSVTGAFGPATEEELARARELNLNTETTTEEANKEVFGYLKAAPKTLRQEIAGFVSRPDSDYYKRLIGYEAPSTERVLRAAFFQFQNTDIMAHIKHSGISYEVVTQAYDYRGQGQRIDRTRADILIPNELTLAINNEEGVDLEKTKEIYGIYHLNSFHPKIGYVENADKNQAYAFIGTQNITAALSRHNSIESLLVVDRNDKKVGLFSQKFYEEIGAVTDSIVALGRDNIGKLINPKELLSRLDEKGLDRNYLYVDGEIGNKLVSVISSMTDPQNKDHIYISMGEIQGLLSDTNNVSERISEIKKGLMKLAVEGRVTLITDKKSLQNLGGGFDYNFVAGLMAKGAFKIANTQYLHDKTIAIFDETKQLKFLSIGSANISEKAMGGDIGQKNIENTEVAFMYGYGTYRDANIKETEEEAKSAQRWLAGLVSNQIEASDDTTQGYWKYQIDAKKELVSHFDALTEGELTQGRQLYKSRYYAEDLPTAINENGQEVLIVSQYNQIQKNLLELTKSIERIGTLNRTDRKTITVDKLYHTDLRLLSAEQIQEIKNKKELPLKGLRVTIKGTESGHRLSIHLTINKTGNVIISDLNKIIGGANYVNQGAGDKIIYGAGDKGDTTLKPGQNIILNPLQTATELVATIRRVFITQGEEALFTGNVNIYKQLSISDKHSGIRNLLADEIKKIIPSVEGRTEAINLETYYHHFVEKGSIEEQRKWNDVVNLLIEKLSLGRELTGTLKVFSDDEVSKRKELLREVLSPLLNPELEGLAVQQAVKELDYKLGKEQIDNTLYSDIRKAIALSTVRGEELYREVSKTQSRSILTELTAPFLAAHEQTYGAYQTEARLPVYGQQDYMPSTKSEFTDAIEKGNLNPEAVSHATMIGSEGQFYRSIASTAWAEPLSLTNIGGLRQLRLIDDDLSSGAVIAHSMEIIMKSTSGLQMITKDSFREIIETIHREKTGEEISAEKLEEQIEKLFGSTDKKIAEFLYAMPFRKIEQIPQRLKNTIGTRPALDINDELIKKILRSINAAPLEWEKYGLEYEQNQLEKNKIEKSSVDTDKNAEDITEEKEIIKQKIRQKKKERKKAEKEKTAVEPQSPTIDTIESESSTIKNVQPNTPAILDGQQKLSADDVLSGTIRNVLPELQFEELKTTMEQFKKDGILTDPTSAEGMKTIQSYFRLDQLDPLSTKRGVIGGSKLRRVALNLGMSMLGDFSYNNPDYKQNYGTIHRSRIKLNPKNFESITEVQSNISEIFQNAIVTSSVIQKEDGKTLEPGMWIVREGKLKQVGKYTDSGFIKLQNIGKYIDTATGKRLEGLLIKVKPFASREENAIAVAINEPRIVQTERGTLQVEIDFATTKVDKTGTRTVGGGNVKGPRVYLESETFEEIAEVLGERKTKVEGETVEHRKHLGKKLEIDKQKLSEQIYALSSLNIFKGYNAETGLYLISQADTSKELKSTSGLEIARSLSLLMLDDIEIKTKLVESLYKDKLYGAAYGVERLSKGTDITKRRSSGETYGKDKLQAGAPTLIGLALFGESENEYNLESIKPKLKRALEGDKVGQQEIQEAANKLFKIVEERGIEYKNERNESEYILKEGDSINKGAGLLAHMMFINRQLFPEDIYKKDGKSNVSVGGLYEIGLGNIELLEGKIKEAHGLTSEDYKSIVRMFIPLDYKTKEEDELTEETVMRVKALQAHLDSDILIENIVDMGVSQSLVPTGIKDTTKMEYQYLLGQSATQLSLYQKVGGAGEKGVSIQQAYTMISGISAGIPLLYTNVEGKRIGYTLALAESEGTKGIESGRSFDSSPFLTKEFFATQEMLLSYIKGNRGIRGRELQTAIREIARDEKIKVAHEAIIKAGITSEIESSQADDFLEATKQVSRNLSLLIRDGEKVKESHIKEGDQRPHPGMYGDISKTEQEKFQAMQIELKHTKQIVLPELRFRQLREGEEAGKYIVETASFGEGDDSRLSVGVLLGEDLLNTLTLTFGDYKDDILTTQVMLRTELLKSQDILRKLTDKKTTLDAYEVVRLRTLSTLINTSRLSLLKVLNTEIMRKAYGDHEEYRGAVGIAVNFFSLAPDEFLAGERYARPNREVGINKFISQSLNLMLKDGNIQDYIEDINLLTTDVEEKGRKEKLKLEIENIIKAEQAQPYREGIIQTLKDQKKITENKEYYKIAEIAEGNKIKLSKKEIKSLILANTYATLLGEDSDTEERKQTVKRIAAVLLSNDTEAKEYLGRIIPGIIGGTIKRTGPPGGAAAIVNENAHMGQITLERLKARRKKIGENLEVETKFELNPERFRTGLVVPSLSRVVAGLGDFDGDSYQVIFNTVGDHTKKINQLRQDVKRLKRKVNLGDIYKPLRKITNLTDEELARQGLEKEGLILGEQYKTTTFRSIDYKGVINERSDIDNSYIFTLDKIEAAYEKVTNKQIDKTRSVNYNLYNLDSASIVEILETSLPLLNEEDRKKAEQSIREFKIVISERNPQKSIFLRPEDERSSIATAKSKSGYIEDTSGTIKIIDVGAYLSTGDAIVYSLQKGETPATDLLTRKEHKVNYIIDSTLNSIPVSKEAGRAQAVEFIREISNYLKEHGVDNSEIRKAELRDAEYIKELLNYLKEQKINEGETKVKDAEFIKQISSYLKEQGIDESGKGKTGLGFITLSRLNLVRNRLNDKQRKELAKRLYKKGYGILEGGNIENDRLIQPRIKDELLDLSKPLEIKQLGRAMQLFYETEYSEKLAKQQTEEYSKREKYLMLNTYKKERLNVKTDNENIKELRELFNKREQIIRDIEHVVKQGKKVYKGLQRQIEEDNRKNEIIKQVDAEMQREDQALAGSDQIPQTTEEIEQEIYRDRILEKRRVEKELIEKTEEKVVDENLIREKIRQRRITERIEETRNIKAEQEITEAANLFKSHKTKKEESLETKNQIEIERKKLEKIIYKIDEDIENKKKLKQGIQKLDLKEPKSDEDLERHVQKERVKEKLKIEEEQFKKEIAKIQNENQQLSDIEAEKIQQTEYRRRKIEAEIEKNKIDKNLIDTNRIIEDIDKKEEKKKRKIKAKKEKKNKKAGKEKASVESQVPTVSNRELDTLMEKYLMQTNENQGIEEPKVRNVEQKVEEPRKEVPRLDEEKAKKYLLNKQRMAVESGKELEKIDNQILGRVEYTSKVKINNDLESQPAKVQRVIVGQDERSEKIYSEIERKEEEIEAEKKLMKEKQRSLNKIRTKTLDDLKKWATIYTGLPEYLTNNVDIGEMISYISQKFDMGQFEDSREHYEKSIVKEQKFLEVLKELKISKQDILDLDLGNKEDIKLDLDLENEEDTKLDLDLKNEEDIKPYLDKLGGEENKVEVLSTLSYIQRSLQKDNEQEIEDIVRYSYALTSNLASTLEQIGKSVDKATGTLLNAFEFDVPQALIGHGGTSLIGDAYNTLIPLLDQLTLDTAFLGIANTDLGEDFIKSTAAHFKNLEGEHFKKFGEKIETLSQNGEWKQQIRNRYHGTTGLLMHMQQIVRDALKVKEGGSVLEAIQQEVSDGKTFIDILKEGLSEKDTPTTKNKQRLKELSKFLRENMGPELTQDLVDIKGQKIEGKGLTGFGALLLLSDYTKKAESKIVDNYVGTEEEKGLFYDEYKKAESIEIQNNREVNKEKIAKQVIERGIITLIEKTQAAFLATSLNRKESVIDNAVEWFNKNSYNKLTNEYEKASYKAVKSYVLSKDKDKDKDKLINQLIFNEVRRRNREDNVLTEESIDYLRQYGQAELDYHNDKKSTVAQKIIEGNILAHNVYLTRSRRGKIDDIITGLHAVTYKLDILGSALEKGGYEKGEIDKLSIKEREKVLLLMGLVPGLGTIDSGSKETDAAIRREMADYLVKGTVNKEEKQVTPLEILKQASAGLTKSLQIIEEAELLSTQVEDLGDDYSKVLLQDLEQKITKLVQGGRFNTESLGELQINVQHVTQEVEKVVTEIKTQKMKIGGQLGEERSKKAEIEMRITRGAEIAGILVSPLLFAITAEGLPIDERIGMLTIDLVSAQAELKNDRKRIYSQIQARKEDTNVRDEFRVARIRSQLMAEGLLFGTMQAVTQELLFKGIGDVAHNLITAPLAAKTRKDPTFGRVTTSIVTELITTVFAQGVARSMVKQRGVRGGKRFNDPISRLISAYIESVWQSILQAQEDLLNAEYEVIDTEENLYMDFETSGIPSELEHDIETGFVVLDAERVAQHVEFEDVDYTEMASVGALV